MHPMQRRDFIKVCAAGAAVRANDLFAAQDLKLVVGFNTCMELAALGAKAPRNAAPDGMISVLARSGKQVARLGLSRREFLGHIRERHKPVDWGAAETELEALAEGEGKLVRLGILGEEYGQHGVAGRSLCTRRERQQPGHEGTARADCQIEQPAARWHPDGRRLCTSYINFYLPNGAVLVPTFDDPMDEPAFDAIAAAFPDRQALQSDVGDLLEGGGGIHRITQQQPAVQEAS